MGGLMENKELISVIIPVYNVEKYLDRCVETIVNQTYKNLEIILVDDGSTDNCPMMCDEWAKKDGRIKVIHKANGGSSSARNAGLNICKGRYIGFIDSDDYVDSDMYENLYDAVKGLSNCLPVVGIFNEDERGVVSSISYAQKREQNKENYFESVLLHKGVIAVWAKLFDRNIIGDVRFDESKLNEDLLFAFAIEKKVDRVVYIGKVGYHYVYRVGSTSRSFGKAVHDIVDNARIVRWYVDDNYPQLKLQAERFEIYQNLAFLLSIPGQYDWSKDKLCGQTRKFVSDNLFRGLLNRYMSLKEKIGLILIVFFPRMTAKLYRCVRKAMR